ncbi:hypothetical protein ACTFIW_003892 [Dictyostelium discoideum]
MGYQFRSLEVAIEYYDKSNKKFRVPGNGNYNIPDILKYPDFCQDLLQTAQVAQNCIISPPFGFRQSARQSQEREDPLPQQSCHLKYVIQYVLEKCSNYAVRILEKSGKSFEFPVQWGLDLQSEHEQFLTEEFFQKPVILTDYPRKIKSF